MEDYSGNDIVKIGEKEKSVYLIGKDDEIECGFLDSGEELKSVVPHSHYGIVRNNDILMIDLESPVHYVKVTEKDGKVKRYIILSEYCESHPAITGEERAVQLKIEEFYNELNTEVKSRRGDRDMEKRVKQDTLVDAANKILEIASRKKTTSM